MSNIFEEVLNDAKGVELKYLGPDYPYWNNIKTPSELGMSGTGSLSALGKDIDGLINYVELLVSGKSNASKTGNALGNKFFIKTGGKCKESGTDTEQDRYIYIDNVPEGNIPFISSGMGVNFSEFKGLIPGVMSNMNAFNPYTILQSFLIGSTPECQEITMQVIDSENNKTTESHYVSLVDIKNMDACSFTDGKNPVSGLKCKETFEMINKKREKMRNKELKIIISSGVLLLLMFMILKKK
uniref:Uncharacterized protein n=1 Tax=viral metagenome TaxID=1070528 RepID=A0A6C0H652_9ZZZZ